MGSEGTIPDDVRRMMAVAQQAFLEMDAAEGLCSDDEGYHPPDLLLVEHLGDGKGKDKGKTGCARLDAALHRMAAIADQPGWSDDEECNGYTRDGTLGLDHASQLQIHRLRLAHPTPRRPKNLLASEWGSFCIGCVARLQLMYMKFDSISPAMCKGRPSFRTQVLSLNFYWPMDL